MSVDDKNFFSDLGYDTDKEITFQVDDRIECVNKDINECLYKYPKNLGFVTIDISPKSGPQECENCQSKRKRKRCFTRVSSRYCQDLCIDYLRSHIDDLREHFEKNKLPIESIKLTRETKEKNCTYTLEIEIEQ